MSPRNIFLAFPRVSFLILLLFLSLFRLPRKNIFVKPRVEGVYSSTTLRVRLPTDGRLATGDGADR